jgi:gliding motility-associated-like protein
MKRILPILVLFNLFAVAAFATHNRAGEITFRQISALKYEINIVTYTKTSSGNNGADRPNLTVNWGDNTTESLARYQVDFLPNDTKRNLYRGVHTYPGASTFYISFEDPNRDDGVVNIPGSVNVHFYVRTQLQINPFLGYNNSPILLQPPIDQGTIDQIFIHNPNAYDPDGDSLAYRLVPCRGDNGDEIVGYTYPAPPPVFDINPVTGDLKWNTPQVIGEYNAAIEISEWRNHVKIGFVIRDLQILIRPSNNKPPVITTKTQICVQAGDSVVFKVKATDPDNNIISLSATGGPFQVNGNKAVFKDTIGLGPLISTFKWKTECSHIRAQPYQVTFSAQDTFPSATFVPLTDLKSVEIKVIAPATKINIITPVGNAIKLNWKPSFCSGANGYKIYRRNGAYNLPFDSCTTGVKEGYQLIDTVAGINNVNYTDNDKGQGLISGLEYCYRIVCTYPDGAESIASKDTCAELKKDNAVITLASVTKTDVVNGEVSIRWSKPSLIALDTIQNIGPYKLELYRYEGFDAVGTATLIKTTSSQYFKPFNDTTHIDNNVNSLNTPALNTEVKAFNYKTVFYSNGKVLGFSKASTTYLSIASSDNKLALTWQNNVPWNNIKYYVYRKLKTDPNFVLLDSTTTKSYLNKGLANLVDYCYYVVTKDSLSGKGFPKPIINNSQISCAAAIDNEVPCAPPNLEAKPDCDKFSNFIHWDNPNNSCSADVLKYRLYFSSRSNGPFKVLDSIMPASQTSYNHQNLNVSLSGCYYVTSIDSVGNESLPSNKSCVDNCPVYNLPNIFTPDNDGINDNFVSKPYRFIESVSMKIFNRWGQLMFETNDADINWNGKNQSNGVACSDGVYFYVCKVNEIHLDGVITKELHGYIQIIHSGTKMGTGN